MTASERQTRVYQAALAIAFHRFGPQADVFTGGRASDTQLAECAAIAAKLEAKVESALNQGKPF